MGRTKVISIDDEDLIDAQRSLKAAGVKLKRPSYFPPSGTWQFDVPVSQMDTAARVLGRYGYERKKPGRLSRMLRGEIF